MKRPEGRCRRILGQMFVDAIAGSQTGRAAPFSRRSSDESRYRPAARALCGHRGEAANRLWPDRTVAHPGDQRTDR